MKNAERLCLLTHHSLALKLTSLNPMRFNPKLRSNLIVQSKMPSYLKVSWSLYLTIKLPSTHYNQNNSRISLLKLISF